MSSLRNSYEKIINNNTEMDFLTSVSMGRYNRIRPINILGNGFGQDLADGELTVWDHKGVLVRLTSDTEIFVSSSNAADVGINVLLRVVNEDFEITNVLVSLNGQTQVSTGVFGILVQFMNIAGTTAPQGDVYAATSTTVVGGVPEDGTTIQSKIIQSYNTTHNGFLIIPKGFTAITFNARASTNSNAKVAKITNVITRAGSLPRKSIEYSVAINPMEFTFKPPIGISEFDNALSAPFPAGTFIEFKCLVNSNDTDIFVSADIVLARADMFGVASI